MTLNNCFESLLILKIVPKPAKEIQFCGFFMHPIRNKHWRKWTTNHKLLLTGASADAFFNDGGLSFICIRIDRLMTNGPGGGKRGAGRW
jgi:hypothetical protein